MSVWKNIATAPKNGEFVLLMVKEIPFTAFFSSAKNSWMIPNSVDCECLFELVDSNTVWTKLPKYRFAE